MDSVECKCGARTAMGNLAREGESPVFFVGGSYKHGRMKTSLGLKNEAEERCLWCGTMWPENLRAAIKKLTHPKSKEELEEEFSKLLGKAWTAGPEGQIYIKCIFDELNKTPTHQKEQGE